MSVRLVADATYAQGLELAPRLVDIRVPREPEGVVLVLHGGASRREAMGVSPTQLSVLRMVPIAKRIARESSGRLAVLRLLNTHRGWDTSHTPVADVTWALGELAQRFGGALPTSLVGHSLGGRAALLAGGAAPVRSVVALAPWVYPTDVEPGLRGRDVLIVHGTGDRIASPERSLALAERLRTLTSVSYVAVEGARHAMLRRHGEFSGLASQWVGATLLGEPLPDALAGRPFTIRV